MAIKTNRENGEPRSKPDFSKEADDMRDSAIKFLSEVEKSGEKLADEIKYFFEQMADHVSEVASSTAKTTASFTEKVAGTGPSQHLAQIIKEMTEAGEQSMRAISEGVDVLREQIMDLTFSGESHPGGKAKKAATRSEAGGENAVKKPVRKKKAKASKSAQNKTQAEVGKKAVRRKAVKKAVKSAAKKKVSVKRTVKKKARVKKTVGS